MTKLTLKTASRKKAQIKMALQGPSGSGKTYSALLIAHGMIGEWSKIAVIDTENGSADLYSDLGEYNTITMGPPFSPIRYKEAIDMCIAAGIECIIIDSVSHEWDWCLEEVDRVTKTSRSGNSYVAWGKVTPQHNEFVNSILQAPVHIIGCIRTKQDYVMNEGANGKMKPEKVGTKGKQREGVEYEFTTVLDLDMNHHATASKDRTGLFMDKYPEIVTADFGKRILDWCNSGADILPKNHIPEGMSYIDIWQGHQAGELIATTLTEAGFKSLLDKINNDEETYWDGELFGDTGSLIIITHTKKGKMLFELKEDQLMVMESILAASEKAEPAPNTQK